MVFGSPAWKPQATLAELMIFISVGVVADVVGAPALGDVGVEVDLHGHGESPLTERCQEGRPRRGERTTGWYYI